jgi:DNA-binding HxlR family transcriptional regulator
MKQGYGQFCPVAVACEIFAERWTPIILRSLFMGADRFNDLLRGAPRMSRSLLAKRLRDLEKAGVIARARASNGAGYCYRLTQAGEEFRTVIEGLGNWGQRWTVRVKRDNLDAGLLMWAIRRRIALDRLLERRVVVQYNFRGIPPMRRGYRRFWLLLERTHVDLCVEDPGFEVDLYVDADLTAMTKVYLGDVSFASASSAGDVRVSGPRELVRAFPSWLLLSHFANVPRPQQQLPESGKGKSNPVFPAAALYGRPAARSSEEIGAQLATRAE